MLQIFKFGTRIRPRFDCHQLYRVIVANGCGYTQGLFWLPWRTILVGQENQIEATRNLPNAYNQRWQLSVQRLFGSTYRLEVRYVGSRLAKMPIQLGTNLNALPQNYLSTLPERDQKTIDYLSERFRFLQPSIRLHYNYYVQLVAIKRGRVRVANLKFWSARQKKRWKLVMHIAIL